jgi:hypothetical protein
VECVIKSSYCGEHEICRVTTELDTDTARVKTHTISGIVLAFRKLISLLSLTRTAVFGSQIGSTNEQFMTGQLPSVCIVRDRIVIVEPKLLADQTKSIRTKPLPVQGF